MSSKRRLRRNACTGKVRHTSIEQARMAIRKLRGSGRVLSYMNAYWCPFCSGVHIGHPKGSGLRKT